MQAVYKASAVVLAAVLLIIAVFSVYAFFNTHAYVSDHEHRTLTHMQPLTADTWFSGEFCLTLDGFMCDHVLLREELIPVTRFLEQLMRVQSRIRIIDMTKPN